jgi:hypothetical protein
MTAPDIIYLDGDLEAEDFPFVRGAWLTAKYVSEPPLVYIRRDPAVILAAALELPEVKALVDAAKPFADIGVGSNPDYQPMIRMDRDAIISLRAALATLKPDEPRDG